MSILIVIYFCLVFEAKHANFIVNWFFLKWFFFGLVFGQIVLCIIFWVEDTTIHERKHSRENISGKREKNVLSSIKM